MKQFCFSRLRLVATIAVMTSEFLCFQGTAGAQSVSTGSPALQVRPWPTPVDPGPRGGPPGAGGPLAGVGAGQQKFFAAARSRFQEIDSVSGTITGDALHFDGELYREELPRPVIGVTHRLRPGDEVLLPNGATRLYFFDMNRGSPSYGMPVLIITTEPTGREVEYYRYEKMKQPANLTDAHFDPARLKKKATAVTPNP